MSDKLLFFKHIDRTMGARVGGKGANLGEMKQSGAPVPNGFCLTTEVYKDFIGDLTFDNMTGAEIRELLRTRALPQYVPGLLREALQEFPLDTLFSVRSSATAEDLPFASFAGQQDTYLNVPAYGLPDAVRNCFASLFTDRAVEYRKQNKVEKALMSVVVQQMVPSEASGIMFTADPVTGIRHLIKIDAGFGLGEALVSGLVTPDLYTYDKRTKRITNKEIARKQCAIMPLPGGGTEKVSLDSSEQALTEAQIMELAGLGVELEEHYGVPQDIEWALADGKLYILQTRAITSLFPVPLAKGDGFHVFSCGNYVQMYTDAMPRLAQDIFGMVLRLGDQPHAEYDPLMLRWAGGRIYLDMSGLLAIGPVRRKLPQILTMVEPLIAQALQEVLARGVRFRRSVRLGDVPGYLIKAAFRGFRRYQSYAADGVAAKGWAFADRLAADFRKQLDAASSPQEQLDAIYYGISLPHRYAGELLPLLLPAILTLRQLEKLERDLLGTEHWVREIGQGLEGNVTTEMGLAVGDLADKIQADGSLLVEFKDSNYATLRTRIAARGDEFSREFAAFMGKYGFRGNGEINISRPRWRDDPEPLAKQLVGIAESKPAGSHRAEYTASKAAALTAAESFVAAVEEKHGRPKAEQVRKRITQYRDAMPLREFPKYLIIRDFGVVRSVLLEIGAGLVRRGRMDEAEDVFHFRFEELYAAVQGQDDLRPLIEASKEEFRHHQKLTPPRVITSDGECLMGRYTDRGLPEGSLPGTGVSAGTVEGLAKVVLDPRDAVVEPGEILVAPFTDPGWTTLFVNAAGLVTEIGGMLTHGAVVAREYGMPGVVGVTDATKIIKTGQRILVDGSAGYVQILDQI